MTKLFYHTQEDRWKELNSPVLCTKNNAWLGHAYYFWIEEQDADFWGIKFKKATGKYRVYSATIDESDVLDTVFNEQHYYMWVLLIEKAAKKFVKKTNQKPTLKEINQYFTENNIWKSNNVLGVKFQDISENPVHHLVKEFQYKKRIQIAVYDNKIISNFKSHFVGECT